MQQVKSVKGEYLLQKYSGKGGWTYTMIPEIAQNKNNPFGWVTVSGFIDGHKIERKKLMPAGDGKLFLSFSAKLRKKIKKEAGDIVFIELTVDESPYKIPEEIVLCFKNEDPKLLKIFSQFKESEQQAFIDWIYATKSEDKKIERIVIMMQKIATGKKLYD